MESMEPTLTNPLITGPFTRVHIELRWGDMDAYGHVNNVTQFRILEEARVRAFGSPTAARDVAAPAPEAPAGRSVHGTVLPKVLGAASTDTDLLVSSHRIEYRSPIPYREGPIAVDTVITGVGPATMDVAYTITETDGSQVYTVAETVVVFVDSGTGRPRRLTEEETAAIEPFIGAPVRMRRK